MLTEEELAAQNRGKFAESLTTEQVEELQLFKYDAVYMLKTVHEILQHVSLPLNAMQRLVAECKTASCRRF